MKTIKTNKLNKSDLLYLEKQKYYINSSTFEERFKSFQKEMTMKLTIFDHISIRLSMIRSFFINVKYGLINLWNWRSIIWNDRDWDYYYLLVLLEYKLNNMSELFKNYGNAVDSKVLAKKLKICSELVKRIKDDNYSERKRAKELEKVYYKYSYEWVDHQKKYEIELLFRILQKNLLKFWD